MWLVQRELNPIAEISARRKVGFSRLWISRFGNGKGDSRQPRSGERMQPMAQAMGDRQNEGASPGGAKEKLRRFLPPPSGLLRIFGVDSRAPESQQAMRSTATTLFLKTFFVFSFRCSSIPNVPLVVLNMILLQKGDELFLE